jgi:hypothetical protein
VEKYLRNGHGRWLLLSSNPPEMVERYVQASLDDKLTVAVLFGRVCTLVHLDGAHCSCCLFSIAFLSNKKGTHEKDMGEGPLPEGLGG